MDAAREIELLIRAKYPILYVVTWEERRLETALAKVCEDLGRTLHTWTVTQGMKPAVSRASGPAKPAPLPGELEALALVHEAQEQTVFLLKDFHPYLRDNRVVRLLRDLAVRLRGKAQTIILSGPVLSLPTDLEKDVTVLDFALPTPEELEKMLDKVIEAVKDNPSVDCKLSEPDREHLVHSAQGLTLDEFESVLARSLVERKKLDVEIVLQEKKQIIRKSGLLEYYPAQTQLTDVGGL
ncbi:MAG: ATPase, partial [Fimbriimonas ginsengisoli]|nr:ATPase [Fimbriimonas ginsengisoli]